MKQNISTFTQTIRSLCVILSSLPVEILSFRFVAYTTRLQYTRRMVGEKVTQIYTKNSVCNYKFVVVYCVKKSLSMLHHQIVTYCTYSRHHYKVTRFYFQHIGILEI
jgi:hypothetical protein